MQRKSHTKSLRESIKELNLSTDQLESLQRVLDETQDVHDQLQERGAMLEAILETTVDAIITINEKGIVETYNRAATVMFGYEPEEVLGHNITRLMPDPYKEMHDGAISRYLATGKAKIVGIGREIIGQKKDGTIFPIYLAVSEVRLDNRIIFTGIIRDITERRQLEKAIVSASEDARREVGQELHDALGQQLTGLSLLAKALERSIAERPERAAEDASSVADLAREAIVESRRLAHGLYPTSLESRGLDMALAELAATLPCARDITCTYSSADKSIEVNDSSIALHLYRITQEAVNNAIKHSEGNSITVNLTKEGQEITLAIEDNGKGISSADLERGGMGLGIMRYRANVMQGQLDICRGSKGGTKVECIVTDIPLG